MSKYTLASGRRQSLLPAQLAGYWTFSIRNFLAMDGKRKTIWIMLFVSSLPIYVVCVRPHLRHTGWRQ